MREGVMGRSRFGSGDVDQAFLLRVEAQRKRKFSFRYCKVKLVTCQGKKRQPDGKERVLQPETSYILVSSFIFCVFLFLFPRFLLSQLDWRT